MSERHQDTAHHPRHVGRPHDPAAHPTRAGEVRSGHSGARGGHGGHGGHDKHAGHSVEMFRSRFWLSLALTLPILIWGHMLQAALGYTAPPLPGASLIGPVLGTAVFLYGGLPFLKGAVAELRDRSPGMMTLIALAISVAFGFSLAVALGYPGMPLWEELATLVTVMLLGHWIEMRSITQARGAVRELAKLLPSDAILLVGERQERVPISRLGPGDVVLIRPGAKVPADGVVREGHSQLNESMLTGESRPLTRHGGDRVVAGTVNGAGSLRVEITSAGEDTQLAGLMRLVERAQASRSRAQALADRAAFFLTLVAVGSAVATAIVWTALGAPITFVIERVVTVLVIACPHALGLAIPLVIAISTTLGARSGLLFRERRGLEAARKLDVVVFDKTGTLTLGEHRVVGVHSAPGFDEDRVLALAAAVEQDSEHPIAHAVTASAKERGLAVPRPMGFRALPGLGAEAVVEGRLYSIGGPNLLRDQELEIPAPLRAFESATAGRGEGALFLIEEGRIVGALSVADAIRPESAEAVRELRQMGVQVALLTGDAEPVAKAVAQALGIAQVFAEVLPERKAELVASLQRQGLRVAMVGDGVNDAPALSTANVGIAIGGGTEVAVEAGDVVLVRNDPRDVARIIHLAQASYRKMVQNLWWAAGYNIVAIPLAAGLFARFGVLLSPAAGAILMSVSTVVVALNAQLLRRHGADGPRTPRAPSGPGPRPRQALAPQPA